MLHSAILAATQAKIDKIVEAADGSLDTAPAGIE